jgi:hypothetical protein
MATVILVLGKPYRIALVQNSRDRIPSRSRATPAQPLQSLHQAPARTVERELHAEWITTTSPDDESPRRQGFPKRETVVTTALESLLELRSSTNSVHLMPLR